MALAGSLRGIIFFSASDGYFGIYPSTTRPGDIVCIVLSALFPFSSLPNARTTRLLPIAREMLRTRLDERRSII